MLKKKQLGQFYTTNYDYILKNMYIPENVNHIIESFAGNCDLLDFIHDKDKYTIELYDIEPKDIDIIKRDCLLNPPCYNDKFVLTNPPYLARNKNENKYIYDKYQCNDLYKCFIMNLIEDCECQGGIIIIPVNFISSIRKKDIELRKKFIEIYDIHIINIFEEQVFDDTSYSICSIFFTKKKLETCSSLIYMYPSEKKMNIVFTNNNNYTIGGEIYNLPINNKYIIKRATKNTIESDTEFITNIVLKCIDDNTKIQFKVVEDKNKYIDNTEKLSARSYATLTMNIKMTLEEQKILVEKMNNYLEEQRIQYNSLFLTNYRENNRKRISFELAFRICNYVLSVL